MRAAIQGEPGAYSHVAAIRLLGEDVTVVPNRTFEDAFGAVREGRADCAVMPVENSLAGPVTESLDLLWSSGLEAVRETHVRIELTLVTTPGRSLTDVTTVASHHVALRQCKRFFREHGSLETTVAFDTAGSIKDLMLGTADYDAAIGPELAGRLHGAEVLARNLEDDPSNFTRFLLLREASPDGSEADHRTAPSGSPRRASLSVTARNEPGGLLAVLAPIAEEGVDLTQVVTRPIPGEPWHYRFHLELDAPDTPALDRALERLEAIAVDLRLFGRYELFDPAG